MKIRIGQFNMENLFNRIRLLDRERGSRTGKPVDPEKFVKEGGNINMLGWQVEEFGPVSTAQRKATATVISENSPDILAVQEVENLFALESFNRRYLKGQGYAYGMVIDGNDRRQIDVGVLSRHPITHVRSYKWLTDRSGQRLFSRDCLEVDITVSKGPVITLFVNHFKSKIGGGEAKRAEQAKAVSGIVQARFGGTRGKLYAVVGDLNMGPAEPEFKALREGLYNTLERLPKDDRWTHAYVKSRNRVEYEQLDHILASPAMDDAIRSVTVERRGIPIEATRFAGKRFPGVQGTGTEASDHCGVFVDLDVR